MGLEAFTPKTHLCMRLPGISACITLILYLLRGWMLVVLLTFAEHSHICQKAIKAEISLRLNNALKLCVF